MCSIYLFGSSVKLSALEREVLFVRIQTIPRASFYSAEGTRFVVKFRCQSSAGTYWFADKIKIIEHSKVRNLRKRSLTFKEMPSYDLCTVLSVGLVWRFCCK